MVVINNATEHCAGFSRRANGDDCGGGGDSQAELRNDSLGWVGKCVCVSHAACVFSADCHTGGVVTTPLRIVRILAPRSREHSKVGV